MPAKRVAYLFGAGATIAEANVNAVEEPLSLAQISDLVLDKARENKNLKDAISQIAQKEGIDIEHYISLLESLHIRKYDSAVESLRGLFCEIIQRNLLKDGIQIKPKLEMALFEMHNEIPEEEELCGVISLNYDSLLDHAFNEIYQGINYGIKCKCSTSDYVINSNLKPLIKLHGSFNWKRGFPFIAIDEQQMSAGTQTEMLWLPPSVGKIRDTYPFNLLWGRACEILDCDILRIVGCKLSQNDWGLMSLLFATQLGNEKPYKIELINSQERGNEIRDRTKFLKNVSLLHQLEGCKDIAKYGSENIFESWLKSKISFLNEKGLIKNTKLKYVNELRGVLV